MRKEDLKNVKFADTDLGIGQYSSFWKCINRYDGTLNNYAIIGDQKLWPMFKDVETLLSKDIWINTLQLEHMGSTNLCTLKRNLKYFKL